MRMLARIAAALTAALTLGTVPAKAADLPTEAQVRAVLPIWCEHKNEKRAKLEREADKLFGVHPTSPPGKQLTQEMLSAHFQAREQWQEPRLEKLNAAYKAATGLDFYATSRVVTEHKLYMECR